MKMKKLKSQKARIVRTTYYPDYDHEAWHAGIQPAPTPLTCPDAFYSQTERVYSSPKAAETKRKPYARLSRTRLAKRLYQAGLRGSELKQVANAILSGPTDSKDKLGHTALGWNINKFKSQFGNRVARAVLRFVKTQWIVVDEAWSALQSPTFTDYIQSTLRIGRKESLNVVQVTQTAAQLSTQ
jgi:hypothetical protein